jgi:hypothetical protein
MDCSGCGKKLTEAEAIENPRTYVTVKGGQRNRFHKVLCDPCDQKEEERLKAEGYTVQRS